MPVANRVSNIMGAVAQRWNGIPTTCHFATIYWLYSEEFGQAPDANHYLKTDLSNPTRVINQMLPFGRHLQRPGRGGLNLTAGSVVVFVHNHSAGHSCIARTMNSIGGYNQLNWFTSAGRDHDYSTHNCTDFNWRSRNEVNGNRNQPCRLVVIDEQVARAVVRQAAMTRL